MKTGSRAIYDTPITRIAGLRSNSKIDNLQPDTIIIRSAGDCVTAIELLEFTRTGDLWPDSLSEASARKTDKYASLQGELQGLYPGVPVTIYPFVVGSRSYMDERGWEKAWDGLGLPQAALTKLMPKIQSWNIEGAREMLSVRSSVRRAAAVA